jgi:predicted patatin/cPLA2 family phospholipase
MSSSYTAGSTGTGSTGSAASDMRRTSLLAVGAGGGHAAFTVGVLKGLFVDSGDCAEWTHLAGISAGALVVGMIQQVDPYNPSEYWKALDTITCKLCNKFPLRPHLRGGGALNAMYSLFFSNSLYQNDLPKFIQSNIDFAKIRRRDRTLSIGMYNQTKGQYETHVVAPEMSEDHIVKMLTASCSVPCALPPQQIGEDMYVDGGMYHVLPVDEIVAFWNAHKGHVDILACYPTQSLQEFKICEEVKSKFALVTQCSDFIIDTYWNTYQRDLDRIDELFNIKVRESAVNTWNVATASGMRRVRFFSPCVGVYIDLVGNQESVAQLLMRHGREAAKEATSAAHVVNTFTAKKMRV